MNKRGQIYLLVALILALVLYMLVTKTNIIYEHEIIDDFETLSRNYDIEASKFMNSLLEIPNKKPEDIIVDFESFTEHFNLYAENQNPDFSLIYLFEYENNLYIGNYLEVPIWIGNNIVLRGCKKGTSIGGDISGGIGFRGDVTGSGCYEILTPSPSEIDITIGNTLYIIDISKGRPEIIIIGREEKGEQRKVYTKEEFVGGNPDREGVRGSEYCNSIKNDPEQSASARNSGVCLEDNQINCKYLSNSEEACRFDKMYCCWNEIDNICEQGRCEHEERSK